MRQYDINNDIQFQECDRTCKEVLDLINELDENDYPELFGYDASKL